MKLLHALHVAAALLIVSAEDVARFSGLMAVAATDAGRGLIPQPPVRAVTAVTPQTKKLRSCMVFTARWCPNCPAQHRQLDKLEQLGWVRKTWGNAPLAHIWVVDADWYQDELEARGIDNLPCTILLEDGRQIGRFERILTAKELAKLLNGG